MEKLIDMKTPGQILKGFFTAGLRDFPLWMHNLGRGFPNVLARMMFHWIEFEKCWLTPLPILQYTTSSTRPHLFPLRVKFWMRKPDSCERKERPKWVNKEIVLFWLSQPWMYNGNWPLCQCLQTRNCFLSCITLETDFTSTCFQYKEQSCSGLSTRRLHLFPSKHSIELNTWMQCAFQDSRSLPIAISYKLCWGSLWNTALQVCSDY